jgi:TonB-linked SusC/RagA family outer membrane protein
MKKFTPKLKWKILTLLLFMVMSFFSFKVIAQSKSVTGMVTDSKNNEPLIGVTINVKGTTIGTATDANGNFKIQVPPNGVLQVKSIGYLEVTIKPDFTAKMTIKLSESSSQLNEVVVVGHGQEKRANLTGAVSSVGEEVFKDRPVANAELALQGEIPGLVITKTSTRPGNENLTIRLRGESSVVGVEPLIVLDGVPMFGSGDLYQINPNDIASVTVLKDASAAIYGSRAQDGVILITTKRGKSGKTSVSLTSNFSQHSKGVNVPWANMAQWASLYLQASMQDKVDANGNPVQTLPQWTASGLATPDANLRQMTLNQPFTYTDPSGHVWGYADNNWQSELYAPSWANEQNLSIRGASDKSAYYLSLGYSLDKGLLKTAFDGQTRYNARLNYDYSISSKVKLQTGFSYEDRINQSPRQSVGQGFQDAPIFPTYNVNGNYYDDYGFRNPVALTQAAGSYTNEQAFLRLNSKLTAEIVKGLTFTGEADYTNINGSISTYDQTFNFYNYLGTGITKVVNPLQYVEEDINKTNYQNYNLQLDYIKTIAKKHNFAFMLGNTAELTENKGITAADNNLQYAGLYTLNSADQSSTAIKTAKGGATHVGLVSYVSRFNYNYAGKYLFEALGRRDGSSRFDPASEWANFYALQTAWRISEEGFMKKFTFINDLKLRGSYGETGGQASLGFYDYIPVVSTGTTLFGSTPALQTTSTVNMTTNLRSWEIMQKKNLGLDYVLFNNKLSGSFDLFQNKNIGMLIGLVYPSVLGATAPTTNNGTFRTNGWEVSASYKDKIGQFAYNVGFNLSDNNSLVTSYFGKDAWNAGVTGIRQGYPLNSLFLYKTNGYFKDNADVAAYYAQYGGRGNLSAAAMATQNGTSALRPGDLKVVDLDGDGMISPTGTGQAGSGDVYYAGDTAPHYTFGINLGAQWKSFDFSTFIQGVGKQNLLRGGNERAPFIVNYKNVNTSYIGKTWTPDYTDAPYPRLSFDAARNGWNYNANDVNVQNLRYARLKSLVIGYTLPKEVLKKIDVSNVRVYFSGSDLFLWSSVKDGYDPEFGTGSDGSYPLFKTLSFGLDITL